MRFVADCWLIHNNVKCKVSTVDDLVSHCKVLRDYFPGSSATLRFRVENNEYLEIDFLVDESEKVKIF